MDWKARAERMLGETIKSAQPVTGATTARLITSTGKTYFAKNSPATPHQFVEEAAGLTALAAADLIRIPKVVGSDDRVLILQWIESEAAGGTFWQDFGRALARLHARQTDFYGFAIDNHIGATPQLNPKRSAREISWTEYFVEYRLQPMLDSPELVADALLQANFGKTIRTIRKRLDQVKENPCLVHGDLWKGNFLCGVGQTPYLIDPAPYFGHREVDLAMTELFGGFAPEFYASYRAEYPLSEGYEVRRTIYNLYHLMNHWILFGESYRSQTLKALSSIS